MSDADGGMGLRPQNYGAANDNAWVDRLLATTPAPVTSWAASDARLDPGLPAGPPSLSGVVERLEERLEQMAAVLEEFGSPTTRDAARGLRGGYRLSRPAHAVCMLDVVSAVGPLPRIHECPLGLPEHTSLCPLHRRIDEAAASIERQLAGTTLDELIDPALSGPAAPALPGLEP